MVTWHVDDLKVSHVKNTMVDGFLEWMEGQYGELRTRMEKKLLPGYGP